MLGDAATPLSIWNMLLSNDILEHIERNTNNKLRLMREKYSANSTHHLRDMDITELRAFLGLLVYSAIFNSSHENIDRLFATDGTGREIFRAVMSKKRFALLLAVIRFDNPEDRAERQKDDPTAAISFVFNSFIENCQSVYGLGQSATIDEMLVSFRGRCRFKMYMPNKPAKYGLKIQCLTDARNSYLYNAYIYSGKNSDGFGISDEYKKLQKPTQAVLRLAEPLFGSNRNITADNWYSSIELVNILLKKNLTYVGTLKKNKAEIPPSFLPNRNRPEGSTIYGFREECTLISHVGKKEKATVLVSSMHNRRFTDPSTNKPEIICYYNETKGGVDSLDEKCSKSTSSRRTRRWPLAFFFRVLDISVSNSYILHQCYKNNLVIKEKSIFAMELAKQLVQDHMRRRLVLTNIPRELRTTISRILGDPEEQQDIPDEVLILEKRTLAVQVDVDRKEQTALVGESVTYMCRVAVPLQYCRVEIPGLRSYNLNKGTSNADVSYYGEGLDAGQCGFTIHKTRDDNNGEIKCTLGIVSEPQESVGTMSLIVARAPKPPELDLSRGTDHLNVYKVDDILQAACMVRDGRPVANISWFLDNEPIETNELSMPTVLDMAKENLQSKIQNLTRKLRATDNGKFLRCVGYHPAYPGGEAETKRRLDIKYAPLQYDGLIEEFGYEVGKTGVINVTVEANPRPSIEWTVRGQKIREGSHDNTGSMEAEIAKELGNGKYVASLRIARISKHDTENEYILTAYNDQGSAEYRVKISTNPEPKGYEVGVAAIIGIVVAILLIMLVVSLLIFAKLNGRWCFSGSESRYTAESSDTESADVRPKETKRRLPSIQLTSAFFKKKHDKVAASEDEPNVHHIDTDEADADTITAEDQEAKGTEDKQGATEMKKEEKDKGLVYAELDLVRSNSPALVPVVKNDDEKTEYAEIVYTPPKGGDENKEKGNSA